MKKKTTFGFGFADSLFRASGRGRRRIDLQAAGNWYEGISLVSPISKKRLGETIATSTTASHLLPLYLLISLIFILLLVRLFVLQIIEGPIFLSQAQGNGIRIKIVHAPRGVIYDRNGEVLARNRPAFRVAWDLGKTKKEDRDKVIIPLSSILKIPEAEIRDKITGFDKLVDEGLAPAEAVTIKNNVDRDTVLLLETKEKDLPGVISEASPIREYPYGEYAAHILGYTGEISPGELESGNFQGYRAADLVGKDGLEKEFEDHLKGQDGSELQKVDSSGVRLGTVYSASPIAGNDLVLSIDIKLQKVVYEALKQAVEAAGAPGGAMVVTNPENGEILALVSYPSFDNNLFAKGISGTDFNSLSSNNRTPLLNRVISASYPPGSTFKMVSALAGLESGQIKPQQQFEDTGSVTLGPVTFNNWYFTQYGRKEGPVDVVKALQRSNDTYFYLLADKIGEKPIQEMATKFGFGQNLGINLPGETSGLVPTDEWKQQVRGEPWYPGNTLNLAIGQGDLLATPLQINNLTATLASGGKIFQPTILKNDTPKILRENFIKPDYLGYIKSGMEKVTQSGGTAWPFFTFGVPTAGKTGTAESSDKKPHAWYTAYGPSNDPQIAVTVMLEKAGEGSSVASPVAKKVLNWWFFDRLGKPEVEASASGEKIGD